MLTKKEKAVIERGRNTFETQHGNRFSLIAMKSKNDAASVLNFLAHPSNLDEHGCRSWPNVFFVPASIQSWKRCWNSYQCGLGSIGVAGVGRFYFSYELGGVTSGANDSFIEYVLHLAQQMKFSGDQLKPSERKRDLAELPIQQSSTIDLGAIAF